MIEHEEYKDTDGTIASRTALTLHTVSIHRSFLVKRMEIEFTAIPNAYESNDAQYLPYRSAGAASGDFQVLGLAFWDQTGGVSLATNILDQGAEDAIEHKRLIWMRHVVTGMGLSDDTDNVVMPPVWATMKTQKTFAKGFPLDKDNTYLWTLFNPMGHTSNHGVAWWLRVRYWGVYL